MDRNKKWSMFLLTGIISALLLVSCYEDIGNYNYTSLNEIQVDTTGVQTSFTINQFDSLKIVPDITFSKEKISEDNLEYKWVIYLDKFVNESSEAKVLSTKRNLAVEITQTPQSDAYAVILYITDKQNGTVYQAKYSVSVLASVVSGWMVLHTKDGVSDLDYIATPNAVPTLTTIRRMKDVYSSMNGAKIEGTPTFVSTVRKNNTVLNYVYVGTDKQFLLLSGTDFSLLNTASDLFKSQPSVVLPQAAGHGPGASSITVLINNNKVHNINNQASQYWDVAFSKALEPSSALSGDVSVAPYIYFTDETAAFTTNSAAFYDTKGKRFVRLIPYTVWEETTLLPFPDQVSTGKFDVNNIGKNLLFFEKGYAGDAFGVFTDGTSRELYRMKFNTLAKLNLNTGEENPEIYNLSRAIYDMSALPEIYAAKFYACGKRGNYFYYATDRNIYTFSYAGSKQAVLVNSPFADGEVITSMKVYSPGTDYSPLSQVTGTLLYVATWNGSEGKLYEFAISSSSGAFNNTASVNGVVDKKAPLNVFTGFGKIMDMCAKVEGVGTTSN